MRSRIQLFPVLLLGALLSLIVAANALAFEEENPFRIGAPPQPFYPADQRIIISDPDDGSVLTKSPARITINFRRFDFDLDPSSLELWIDGVEWTRQLHFWTDMAWVDLPIGSALGGGGHELMAKISDHSGAYWATTVSISILFPLCPGGCPWPFAPTSEPSPVSNLMEDWQDFNSTPYFHSGLDIRADAGTDVHSCTAGTVVNVDNYAPGGALKWEVAVLDAQGYVWQYHHLDLSTITVTKGDPVAQGQVLGKVVEWTIDVHGYRYDHLHLNIARWYGGGPVGDPYIDGWIYYNPLLYLVHGSYADTDAPNEFDIYYGANENNAPFDDDNGSGTPSLTGNVDVIAHLRDHRTVMAPANGQPYELSPYELAYSIVPINTRCGMGFLPRTKLIRFGTVPGGKLVSKQLQVLETIYKPTVNYSGVTGTYYTYAGQEYFYVVTNVHNGYPDGPNGSWNTAQMGGLGPLYPDGTYQVKVYAKDIDDNETVTPATVQVANGLTYTGLCPPSIIDWGWIQGLHLQSPSGGDYPYLPSAAPVEFGSPVDGSAHATLDNSKWPAWYFDLPDRGMRVGIGLLNGHVAGIEYVPLLGDVIIDADAEMQMLPPGGLFDPALPSRTPVPLHLTTRLVRDPATGAAMIGRPADYGAPDFKLVMAAPLQIGGETMVLKAGVGAGSNSKWDLMPAGVEGPSPGLSATRLFVRSAPNPLGATGRLQVVLDRAAALSVDVFDAGGRRVRQIFSGRLSAGASAFDWDGRNDLGALLPAGVYVVRARSGAAEARAKLVVMR